MRDLYQNMLDKSFRKRLLSQDWEDIMKHNSNPSQTWTRLRDKANRSIRDLILLAKKLPNDKQAEIFNEGQIQQLLWVVINDMRLHRPITPDEELFGDKSDARRTALAHALVWAGINVCISKFRVLMFDTPDLAKPTITHLEQSVNICRDIANRAKLEERDRGTEKQGISYLFDWNEDTMLQHNNRFCRFTMREFNFVDPEFESIKLSNDRKEIGGAFRDTVEDGFLYEDEEKTWWHFIIRLDDDKTATFKVFDENNNERATISLIVKQEHNSLRIYEKRK